MTTTTTPTRYTVTAPATPGAAPTTTAALDLRDARRIAASYRHRGDLTRQDVRIDVHGRQGHRVEYAGPAR